MSTFLVNHLDRIALKETIIDLNGSFEPERKKFARGFPMHACVQLVHSTRTEELSKE